MFEEIPERVFGNGDEERAVSPVIGVVLMVAVTVILAAVIAVFVMGIGDDLDEQQEATGAASFDWTDDDKMIVTLTSEGNAEDWEIRGSLDIDDADDIDPEEDIAGAGHSVTLTCDDLDGDSGEVSVVAAMEDSDDASFTTIGSEQFSGCGSS